MFRIVAPLKDLMEVGRFREGGELPGQPGAKASIGQQANPQRGADLNAANLDAEPLEAGQRRFRILIFHGEMASVITDLDVIEHDAAGGLLIYLQLVR